MMGASQYAAFPSQEFAPSALALTVPKRRQQSASRDSTEQHTVQQLATYTLGNRDYLAMVSFNSTFYWH
jgi:hypothetical protein